MEPIAAIAAVSSVTALIHFSGRILSGGYQYLAKVAKAPKEIRQLLIETAALNSLLDQLELLLEDDTRIGQDALRRLEKTAVLLESNDVLQAVDKCIAACRENEQESAQNLRKRLRWPHKDKAVKELLQQFHVIREIITTALSIDAAGSLNRIEVSAKKTEDTASFLRLEEEKRHVNEEKERLKTWLRCEIVHQEDHHVDAFNRRQPGTSSWFLEDASFCEWLSEANSLMWLYGIPGCGKTVLSSTIIEYLRTRTSKPSSRAGLVYFYCSHQESKTQRFRSFIGSAINQLLQQQSRCVEDLTELYSRRGGESSGMPSDEECLTLLRALTVRFSAVYIVVDALDECADVEPFIHGLKKLRSPTTIQTTARVLITSRQEVQIEKKLSLHITQSMCLTQNNGSDIHHYVRNQVHTRLSSGKLKLRDRSLQEAIVSALCDGADGMFLWAHIQLERVCKLRTDRDIKAALHTLPSGLDETYIRTLEHIQANRPEAVQEILKVFQWLIGSFDALALSEISEAISVQPEDTALDQDGIANDLDDIAAMCGSLVILDRTKTDTRVAFAHLSIEEFLRSDRIKRSSVAAFHMDLSLIHLQMAQICIQYLSFADFDEPCATEQLSKRIAQYKLLLYAAQHWIKHLKLSNPDRSTIEHDILPHLDWFLNPSLRNLHFYSWAQVFRCEMPALSRGPGMMQRIRAQPALFYALLYGVSFLVDLIFPTGEEVHQRFWDGMTPLHVVAYAGHYIIAKRLLDSGANTEVRTVYKKLTPLHLAAEYGHAQIVELLLSHGADIHAQSTAGTTAFYRAPRGGSLKVLDMLHAHGSDVNVCTCDGFTALHEAVEVNELPMIQRLVDWGINLNAKTVFGDTAAMIAAELHRWDTVQMLDSRMAALANAEPAPNTECSSQRV